jgi:hypothetical protein
MHRLTALLVAIVAFAAFTTVASAEGRPIVPSPMEGRPIVPSAQ